MFCQQKYSLPYFLYNICNIQRNMNEEGRTRSKYKFGYSSFKDFEKANWSFVMEVFKNKCNICQQENYSVLCFMYS